MGGGGRRGRNRCSPADTLTWDSGLQSREAASSCCLGCSPAGPCYSGPGERMHAHLSRIHITSGFYKLGTTVRRVSSPGTEEECQQSQKAPSVTAAPTPGWQGQVFPLVVVQRPPPPPCPCPRAGVGCVPRSYHSCRGFPVPSTAGKGNVSTEGL